MFVVMVMVMEIGTHGRPVKCPGRGVHEHVSDGVIQLTCNTLFLRFGDALFTLATLVYM